MLGIALVVLLQIAAAHRSVAQDLVDVTVFFEGGELSANVCAFYRYLKGHGLLRTKPFVVPEGKLLADALLEAGIIVRGYPGADFDRLLCELNPHLCPTSRAVVPKLVYSAGIQIVVPDLPLESYEYTARIPYGPDTSRQNIARAARTLGASVEETDRVRKVPKPSEPSDLSVRAIGYKCDCKLPSEDVRSANSALYRLAPGNVFVAMKTRASIYAVTNPSLPEAQGDPCDAMLTNALDVISYDFPNQLSVGVQPPVVAVFEDDVDWSHCDFYETDGRTAFDNPPGVVTNLPCNDPCPDPVPALSSGEHGTHIAGIIAARRNGKGITGVDPFAKLLVYPTKRDGLPGDIVTADNHGASLANMSWGYAGTGPQLYTDLTAVRIKQTYNILFIVAAGNAQPPGSAPLILDPNACGTLIPACQHYLPNVLVVGALNASGSTLLDASNRGAEVVHLAAPGENIVSDAASGRMAVGAGTSSATAFVTGAAAILMGLDPSLTPLDVKQRLMYTADFLPGLDSLVVSGRLNVRRAVTSLHWDVLLRKGVEKPEIGRIIPLPGQVVHMYRLNDVHDSTDHPAVAAGDIRRIVWNPGSDDYTVATAELRKTGEPRKFYKYPGVRFQPRDVSNNQFQHVDKQFCFRSPSEERDTPLSLSDIRDLVIRGNKR